MLLDVRSEPLSWENFNMDVIVESHRGMRLTGTDDFLLQIDQACALGKQPRPKPRKGIVKIIEQMIADAQID